VVSVDTSSAGRIGAAVSDTTAANNSLAAVPPTPMSIRAVTIVMSSSPDSGLAKFVGRLYFQKKVLTNFFLRLFETTYRYMLVHVGT
jgi:hypothetical protein